MQAFGNITAHGTVYLYPDELPQDLVWIDQNGHTNYWCSVQGGTSGSSKNPRSEGRQTLPGTAVSFNWLPGSARHSMAGRVRVQTAPSSGKVIIGQIHAVNALNPFLMVIWWNGYVRIDFRDVPLGTTRTLLKKQIPLGQVFEYCVQVDELGKLTATLDELSASAPVNTKWSKYPFYFKAGAYVIDNKGDASEGGWVIYESFDVFNGTLSA
ncbi:polysaccharide lyase family 7 protein [Pseudomonas auratipiscis]|uniref:Polysaccharide lyase family 7 protein n=1 Tax=Pseudomonas auratipiscis TaxID=3115853 RepID=A0AB35WR41_9PSED|nr:MULTISPECIES: polysaccharide lyase family 7 protein [unclassified Pseudomonas]MEE1866897.1 polysaccharide lyase family 7 protein [Pseudomonas sp. 120P]MEE1960595.1 polysaccharide lyase family 7 protein [Pseudomonas sp. 119P]